MLDSQFLILNRGESNRTGTSGFIGWELRIKNRTLVRSLVSISAKTPTLNKSGYKIYKFKIGRVSCEHE